ncbi:GNAT family N-acetyltransferase, partial [Stenotrophomonas maltophilia]|uniref:GNAT family N-acetyltransferase n=1 Tax=Stenotrophomonas maltophilia TaxID=40324 RepID=UPI0013DB31FB
PDLGFAILPEFENKGFISEAVEAVMQFAFQELKLEAVQGITTPDNLASIRLLEKAGMTYKINTKLPD